MHLSAASKNYLCQHRLGTVNKNCFQCRKYISNLNSVRKVVEVKKCGACESKLVTLRYNKLSHVYCPKCLGYKFGNKKPKLDPKQIFFDLIRKAKENSVRIR